MSKKPVVLMILDGYGLNDRKEHNAVAEAKPAAWRWGFPTDRWEIPRWGT